ncbi:MAG: formate/nitrite transporter family protein [Deltaproteobacteria bacterium]|nr:formate/nitrite transporter family protein [Deltaproteobacteria bacterium]
MSEPFSIDALLPPEIAKQAEEVGARKCRLPFWPLLTLAVLAGAFIALGAIFSTTVSAGTAGVVPSGIARLLAGVVFCLGLVLVILGGAELFTGNALISMAWASGTVSTGQMVRNWGIVYTGNLLGALATAGFLYLSRQYTFAGGAVGLAALEIARAKTALGLIQAVVLGVLCNALVCLAVWLCLGARGTADKILAIVFPISAFVAVGFEHSVANMYFIPIGLLIKTDTAFLTAIGKSATDYVGLTWTNFLLVNLLPVTAGNLIGGVVLVGLVYWFVYLRKIKNRPSARIAASSAGY